MKLTRRQWLKTSGTALAAGAWLPAMTPTLRASGQTAAGARASAPASSPVRLGVCASTDHIESVAHAGFDYLEPPAAAIAEMREEQLAEVAARLRQAGIRCEAFNSFIRRPELVVVGEHVPTDALRNYVDHTLGRCRRLGATVVVWGSAGSRNVPAGFSRSRAWEQIRAFLAWVGPIAQRHQVTVAIEPLRTQESNILNTGAESWRMVRQVNHPGVKMIIDYYHLREMNEDPQIIWRARRDIVHYHFANPAGRRWPHSLSEDGEYREFFRLVTRTGFAGGLSIEANGSVERDGAASLAFFRQGFEDARTESSALTAG